MPSRLPSSKVVLLLLLPVMLALGIWLGGHPQFLVDPVADVLVGPQERRIALEGLDTVHDKYYRDVDYGKLSDAAPLVAPFYVPDDAVPIAQDARAGLGDNAAQILDAAITALETVPQNDDDLLAATRPWNHEVIETHLRQALLDGLGLKPRVAFGPLRTGIYGKRISPPLFESMEILGKDSTLTRLGLLRKEL